MSYQRSVKTQLGDERIARLDDLGIIWNLRVAKWEEMYGRLVAYKDVHGDCNVPQGYEPDPKLGRWVSSQRISKRMGKLGPERTLRLDALGFDWGMQD